MNIRDHNLIKPSKQEMLFVLKELLKRKKLTEEEYYRAVHIVQQENY